MECVELAPAFEPRHTSDSGSKLHALHTLRETRPPLSSVCAICSVSPENLRKKTRFSPILFSAPGCGLGVRRRAELLYPKLLFFCADFSQAKGARPLGCRDPEWSNICGFGETLGIFRRFCSLKAALLSFRLRRPGDRRALPTVSDRLRATRYKPGRKK